MRSLACKENCARTTERESCLKRAKPQHELVPSECRSQGESKNSSVQNERRRYGNLRDQKQKYCEERQRAEFGGLTTRILRGPDLGFWQVGSRILAAARASDFGGVRGGGT